MRVILDCMIDQRQRVYELQAGLYEFQFRKVLFISFRIEFHETIRLRQGMRSNDEISKQTPRPLLRISQRRKGEAPSSINGLKRPEVSLETL
jgi:hypothetical protein